MLWLVTSSCVLRGVDGREALPPPSRTLAIVMTEYRFRYVAPSATGRVVVRVSNNGTTQHSLSLISLPDDFPPIDEQLRSDTRRGAPTIARLPSKAPGQGGAFAIDLTPGRYAFVCFVLDPDGVTHAMKGMSSEFRIA